MTEKFFKRLEFESHRLHNGEHGFRKGFVAIVIRDGEMFIGHDYSSNTNIRTRIDEKDLIEWIKYFERI